MAGPGQPVLSFNQLSRHQPVRFYSGDGWKKGTITRIEQNSCSVLSFAGSKPKTITIFDVRNLRTE